MSYPGTRDGQTHRFRRLTCLVQLILPLRSSASVLPPYARSRHSVGIPPTALDEGAKGRVSSQCRACFIILRVCLWCLWCLWCLLWVVSVRARYHLASAEGACRSPGLPGRNFKLSFQHFQYRQKSSPSSPIEGGNPRTLPVMIHTPGRFFSHCRLSC